MAFWWLKLSGTFLSIFLLHLPSGWLGEVGLQRHVEGWCVWGDYMCGACHWWGVHMELVQGPPNRCKMQAGGEKLLSHSVVWYWRGTCGDALLLEG